MKQSNKPLAIRTALSYGYKGSTVTTAIAKTVKFNFNQSAPVLDDSASPQPGEKMKLSCETYSEYTIVVKTDKFGSGFNQCSMFLSHVIAYRFSTMFFFFV